MVVVNDATVKGGSYYPLTVSGKHWHMLDVNVHRSLGQEAFTSTRDRAGAWTSMCLCRYVVNGSVTFCPKSNMFDTVESGGAALPHQANVRFPETRNCRYLTDALGVPR